MKTRRAVWARRARTGRVFGSGLSLHRPVHRVLLRSLDTHALARAGGSTQYAQTHDTRSRTRCTATITRNHSAGGPQPHTPPGPGPVSRTPTCSRRAVGRAVAPHRTRPATTAYTTDKRRQRQCQVKVSNGSPGCPAQPSRHSLLRQRPDPVPPPGKYWSRKNRSSSVLLR